MNGRRSPAALALVLGSLAITLSIGAAVRAPCSDLENFARPEVPYRLCYTDVVALWHDRQPRGGQRIPGRHGPADGHHGAAGIERDAVPADQ
jgi:hypothetical protein